MKRFTLAVLLCLFSATLYAQDATAEPAAETAAETTEGTVFDKAAAVANEVVVENEDMLKQAMANILNSWQ
jgi:hypothetical protein